MPVSGFVPGEIANRQSLAATRLLEYLADDGDLFAKPYYYFGRVSIQI